MCVFVGRPRSRAGLIALVITAAPSATAPVTLDDISTAAGCPVDSGMPDTNSAISFQGYESCRYQFTTPAGGAQLDVDLVIGANPLDGKSPGVGTSARSVSRLVLSKLS